MGFTFIEAGHFQQLRNSPWWPHGKRMLKCVVGHPNRWLRLGRTASCSFRWSSNIYCFPSKLIPFPPQKKSWYLGIVIVEIGLNRWHVKHCFMQYSYLNMWPVQDAHLCSIFKPPCATSPCGGCFWGNLWSFGEQVHLCSATDRGWLGALPWGTPWIHVPGTYRNVLKIL